MRRSVKLVLMMSAAFAAIALEGVKAEPGGITLRQSSYFQGDSWAGVAAGGPSVSSMFWNPATITQAGLGLTVEAAGTIDAPRSDITPFLAISPSDVNLTGLGSSGDLFDKATLVPSFYAAYGLTNSLSFGLAVNSPFGLKTVPNPLWSGMFYSRESNVKDIDVTPTVAWKVNNWLSVGAGVQIDYFKVKLDSAFPGSGLTGPFPFLAPLGPDELDLAGKSWGIGYTAGVTITPTLWTTIGVGYRSGIDQKIHGDIFRPAFVVPVVIPFPPFVFPVGFPQASTPFNATVPLPAAATASIRQKITNSFTLLGTVEWTGWSRLGTVPLVTSIVSPGIPTQLPFQWRDSWMISGGAEYQWGPRFALRAGVAWDQSPVTDATRATRLPDADHIWVSAGATYKCNEQLALEFAYSHIFVKDAPINLSPTSGNPTFNPGLGTFIGTASSEVNVFTLGLRYRFVPPAPRVIRKG